MNQSMVPAVLRHKPFSKTSYTLYISAFGNFMTINLICKETFNIEQNYTNGGKMQLESDIGNIFPYKNNKTKALCKINNFFNQNCPKCINRSHGSVFLTSSAIERTIFVTPVKSKGVYDSIINLKNRQICRWRWNTYQVTFQ